ncbi:MAG: glycoside hydrolase, partial [Kiritimatiellae bacterium]|nr:glycoside hydrolase [Kiritimatiellia bacterium]
EVVFPELSDWTKSTVAGIKYYSGAAIYSKRFRFSRRGGARCRLELGEVLDVGIATVRLNGKDLGTVWTKPFGLDATEALADGENVLEVKVVNSWHNRVLGDQLNAGGKVYTQTNIEIANRNGRKGKLSPSGLLGPVVVKMGE